MAKDKHYKVNTLQAALCNVEIRAKLRHNDLVCYLANQTTMMSEDIVDLFNAEIFKYYRIKNITRPLYEKISFVTLDVITETNLRAKIRNLFSSFVRQDDIQELTNLIIENINFYYDPLLNYKIDQIIDIKMRRDYD